MIAISDAGHQALERLIESGREILAACEGIQADRNYFYGSNALTEPRRAEIRQHLASGCIGCLVHYARFLSSHQQSSAVGVTYACDFPAETSSATTERRPFYGWIREFVPTTISNDEQSAASSALDWFFARYPDMERGLNFERIIDIPIAEGIIVSRFRLTNLTPFVGYQPLSALRTQTDGRYQILIQQAPQLIRTVGMAACLSHFYSLVYPRSFPKVSPILFATFLLLRPNDTVDTLARRHYLAPGKYLTPKYGDLDGRLKGWLSHIVAFNRPHTV